MTNPFMYLGIQRKGFPIQFTEPPQTWLPSHPWIEAAEKFDDLIFKVLQNLIDAAYPNHSVRSHRTKNKYRYYSEFDEQPAWSIGYFYEQTFSSHKCLRPTRFARFAGG